MLFETDRLVVRRASAAEDLPALLSIFGDSAKTMHFGSGQPWTEDQIDQFHRTYPESDPQLISTPGLVLLKPDLEPIGFGGVGYYAAPGNTADLFFIFRHQFWGRGLATECARAALAAAWQHSQIDGVHATVHPANAASIRVLEKCGMTRERYLPAANRLLYAKRAAR